MLQHVHEDRNTGRLSFRRRYPPELVKIIGSHELKRSLKAKSITAAGAMEIYTRATSEWQQAVDHASKVAAGAFHPLGASTISKLTDALKNEHLTLDEEVRWLPRPLERKVAARDQMMADLTVDLAEAKALRSLGDLSGVTSIWGQAAFDFAAAHGFHVDREAESFGEYVRAFHDSMIDIMESVGRRSAGENVPTPPMPSFEASFAEAPLKGMSTASPSFEDIAQGILDSPRQPIGASTKQMSATALRFFRETFGTPKPAEITKERVSHWLDLLARRPKKLPADQRMTPLRDLVALYEDAQDVERLSPKTMASLLGALSALWNKAQRQEGSIPDSIPNPFVGRASLASHRPEERQELSLSEIHGMFALPIFTRGDRPKRGRGEASYWLPLLLLWTGARPEELAQLMTTDVFPDPDDPEGRWMLRITDQGTHPVKGRRSLKTTKTESGRRTFPVHRELLKLNFIAFVDHVRASGQTALFPELTTKGERGLLFAGWGEWWSLYVREKGILPPGGGRRPSREFRHNWNTAARQSRIPQDAREYLLGHVQSGGSANDLYGGKGSLGDYVDSLHFKGLDLTGVVPWKAPPAG